MKIRKFALAVSAASVCLPAQARENVVQPVQVGEETVRYEQGVATVDLQKGKGAVQVTPLGMDHGSVTFGIAVLNDGDTPTNIDVTNFVATAGDQSLPVFTKDQLESKAKNRAMWAQIAVAVAGGLSAAAAANQRDVYHSSFVTPRGTYRASYSAPSTAGQIQAAAIAVGTGATLASIQNRLDATRAALGDSIVQLTTVDPGESYAGRIVLAKIKSKKMPQKIAMVVNWNGEVYPFAFQMAKKGTPAPIFTAMTAPERSEEKMPTPSPAPEQQPTAN